MILHAILALEPPVQISAKTLDDNIVELAWRSASLNGDSEIYKLYVTLEENLYTQPSDCIDNDLSERARIDTSNSTSLIIKDLQPFSNYSMRIRSENSQGESEFSEKIFFTTKQAPPSPPRDVSVIFDESHLDETHVKALLEWKSPCKFNGFKSIYTINMIGKRPGHPEDMITQATSIESFEVDKLKRDFKYEVKIKASNQNKMGDAAIIVFETPSGSEYCVYESFIV